MSRIEACGRDLQDRLLHLSPLAAPTPRSRVALPATRLHRPYDQSAGRPARADGAWIFVGQDTVIYASTAYTYCMRSDRPLDLIRNGCRGQQNEEGTRATGMGRPLRISRCKPRAAKPIWVRLPTAGCGCAAG